MPGFAHPIPHDTSPICSKRLRECQTSGPPESPWHASTLFSIAQITESVICSPSVEMFLHSSLGITRRVASCNLLAGEPPSDVRPHPVTITFLLSGISGTGKDISSLCVCLCGWEIYPRLVDTLLKLNR